LKEIRNFGEPILRILGFKPISTLRFWDNLRPSYFIYPSDAAVTGSTRTFASLHKKMFKDKLMALAWLIPRRNQAPVFSAIIPQQEEFDDKGAQSTPPGMHCIVLPFQDDIRANPVEETATGSPLITSSNNSKGRPYRENGRNSPFCDIENIHSR
jgi:ATP-dependent DNA helicase 2 subunit 1